ncbi:hypothetical protein EDC02_2557 [Micromonospora sp. Llam0]|uniref:phthiocerol/phthiodiolone dimycocerosyl transferase family protein n=1 Tax=Micromonospora sp. Llam0 TaxID=2485143 RepID=UPI000F46DAD6|nr:hypothetical protein [Micromonospora sp. Llam0]ROO60646.1 hypothetical protein EDC02_2557 [Micromonospora sp. Llam0]
MNAPTNSHSPTEVRRALSPLERWYWIADQVSPLNVIARVQVRGPLPEPMLRAALDRLRRRHPLLRVAIATEPDGRSPRFVPTDRPIPLRLVADDETSWVRRVDEHELVDRVDWRSGPLCRTVALTRPSARSAADDEVHDLLLTMPHCVADGTTVLSLLRQWIDLAEQERARAAGTDGSGDTEPGEPALPGCEAMFPRRYRGLVGTLRLRWLLAQDLFRVRRYRPARVVPSRFVPFTERRTRLISRALAPAQVEALVAACRSEQTTVHGALAAAMVLAVATEAGSPAPGHVTIGSPITFRDALVPAIPERAVGTYVATVPTFVAYRPDRSLWDVARSIGADLAVRRRAGGHFAMVDLVTISCPRSVATAGRFIAMMERTGPVNLCLSNIGRHDFPDRVGPWRLSGAQFVAGLSVVGYFVSTVNTSHGQLSWNFTYVPDALSPDRAAALVEASIDAVLAAIDSQPERSRP